MAKNFLTVTASRREVERGARKLARTLPADWPHEPRDTPLDRIADYARSLIADTGLTDDGLQAARERIAKMQRADHDKDRKRLAQADFRSTFDLPMTLAATLDNVDAANRALNTDSGDLHGAIAQALTCTGLAGLLLARAVELKHSLPRSKGGHAKLTQNPKAAAIQAAKRKAHKLWKDWKAGNWPGRNAPRSNEQFARACMERWPVLTSAENILSWCTEWAKPDGA